MYTREQKEKALAMYDATQSIAEVIRRLGYPSKQALYTWIANRDKPWQKPNGFRGVNTAEHPRHPSVNLKISAIRACFEEGNDVQFISAQIGYSRASIYAWHRRYLKECWDWWIRKIENAASCNRRLIRRIPQYHLLMKWSSWRINCTKCKWKPTFWKQPLMC